METTEKRAGLTEPQKAILAALALIVDYVGAIDLPFFQKLVFVLRQCQDTKGYFEHLDFNNARFGPFSEALDAEVKTLIDHGFIQLEENGQLLPAFNKLPNFKPVQELVASTIGKYTSRRKILEFAFSK